MDRLKYLDLPSIEGYEDPPHRVGHVLTRKGSTEVERVGHKRDHTGAMWERGYDYVSCLCHPTTVL